jgi:hypothetical protein
MAQKVQILFTCDIDEGTDGVETVAFGFDGKSYALELCAKDRQEFTDLMDGYVAAARTEGGRAAPRRAARPTVVEPKPDLNEMREWARANGYRVADRGRVSGEVREAYAAAHA